MSCKNDYQATLPHTVYILIQNFKSELSELIFDKFTITKVSNGNYEEYEEIFTSGLYRNLSQYIIKREHKKIPPLPTGMSKDFDTSGFGNIPYESEDLIFLLRLFKEGDIVFKKQVIKKHDGEQFSQYKYPMVFSEYHSPEYYEMSDDDIPKFNKFFSDAPHWKGWNSSWFKISKNYFLWGSSKEFHPGRNDERILDYMISLEAVLVYENEFISRRLRERAVEIIKASGEQRSNIKKLINKFYGFRSILAHGDTLSESKVRYIDDNKTSFGKVVRELLQKVIKDCPSQESDRKEFLRSLYDITDKDRAQRIISDINRIKDAAIKKDIIQGINKILPQDFLTLFKSIYRKLFRIKTLGQPLNKDKTDI